MSQNTLAKHQLEHVASYSHSARVSSFASPAERLTQRLLQKAVSKLPESLREPIPLSSGGSSNSVLEFPDSDSPMVPPSEYDKILGSLVPATVRDTRRSKRGKPEVSEPKLLDVPPAKKLKGKPGPKPKKKPAPKKAQDSSDDAEVPSDPGPPTKKSKQSRPKEGMMVEYDNDGNEIKPVVDIICMIPGVATEGNQCVPLSSSHLFEDALEVVHETIGCVSVARKPMLKYKLSSAKEIWKFGYITLFIVHISPPSQKFGLFE
ncbi:hypothetical protein K438DRAFT_1759199 [Mycena galopus ATCC 62051]|nr:hypothetical protein K438DRAFT_1759199 [Mycena galopus ATCC 62051]